MEDDRLSSEALSRAALAVLRVPDYDRKLAAALERERRDPAPRSDTEKIIRRQMPVSIPAPEAESDIYAAIAAAIERPRPAKPRPERWFSTRRGRIRVEAYVAGGSLAILLGPAAALFYVSEVVGVALLLAAAPTMFIALGAIYIDAVWSCRDDDTEDANERAVARLVSGGGIGALPYSETPPLPGEGNSESR